MTLNTRSRSVEIHSRRSAVTLILMGTAAAATADVVTDSAKRARIEALIQEFEPRFTVTQVEASIAQVWSQEKRVVFIDVREPKEIAVSAIPGAITQSQFESNPGLYQGKPLVAYCTIGYRSSKFAERWRQRGVTIDNLRGGVLLWAHARGKMVDARRQPTQQIHVYGASWDLLPSSYHSVY